MADESVVSNARQRAKMKDESGMLIRLRRGIKIQPRARTGRALWYLAWFALSFAMAVQV
jgi:hypothetical protein